LGELNPDDRNLELGAHHWHHLDNHPLTLSVEDQFKRLIGAPFADQALYLAATEDRRAVDLENVVTSLHSCGFRRVAGRNSLHDGNSSPTHTQDRELEILVIFQKDR